MATVTGRSFRLLNRSSPGSSSTRVSSSWPRTAPAPARTRPVRAIFAQNLDEFFMVRVAGLLEARRVGVLVRSVDGLASGQALAAIHERVGELTARQGGCGSASSEPALAKAGIEVATIEQCTDREREKLARYFEREVYPILTPLAVRPGQSFPYVRAVAVARRDRLRPRHR